MNSLRNQALMQFQAGMDAADPAAAVASNFRSEGETLQLRTANGDWRGGSWQQVHLVAFGKAACAMAGAALEVIPSTMLRPPALVVTNYENVRDIPACIVFGSGHPLPDESGAAAARAISSRLIETKSDELVLVLISGGGSALLPAPVPDVSLTDKIATTELLLGCGADIHLMNCVRKHLSQLKGGGLARLGAPADIHSLILSDVIGDDLTAIASGATVADPTTFADAAEILRDHNVWDQLPESVRSHMERGLNGDIPDTPKPGDTLFEKVQNTLIGSNRQSLQGVAKAAEQAGFAVEIVSEALSGEARDAARQWADILDRFEDISEPTAFLAGGETTVTLRGQGKGGRNQEFALAFALAAEQKDCAADWVLLSGGTDGRDGPTDAAGGCVSAGTADRIRAAGADPQAMLDDNDAYHALEKSGDLVITGTSGTNVADLQILLVSPH